MPDATPCFSVPAPALAASAKPYARVRDGFLEIGHASWRERWGLSAKGGLQLFQAGTLETAWFLPPPMATFVPLPAEALAKVEPGQGGWSFAWTVLPVPGGPRARFSLHPAIVGSCLEIEYPSGLIPPRGTEATRGIDLAPTGVEVERSGHEVNTTAAEENAWLPAWLFVACHLRVTAIDFIDQTDSHANYVQRRTWLTHPAEARLALAANLVLIENPATGNGLLLLLAAPDRSVRAAWSSSWDFLLQPTSGRPGRGFGITLSLPPRPDPLCPLIRLAYTGGEAGATRALHALQRSLHPVRTGRDLQLLSNTWGDRARAERLSETWVLGEIAAAARLGLDVVQLDDGWQRGRTSNTVQEGGVWNGFWAADSQFWQPDPVRFPRGLAPLSDAAGAAGLRLGLWYAPDSSDEFHNWQRDAQRVVELHREHRVDHFKFDGVKLHGPLALARYQALIDEIARLGAGRILIDLDVTAEHRTGYWGRLAGATLFLENRYTDWARYYPHQTLNALWQLSPFVAPSRLRLEFLNPERNDLKYAADPLRPSAYPVATLFAIVMLASPLAWLESSALTPAFFRAVGPLISRWKEHRETLAAGSIHPLGQAPDGYAWTGFLVCDPAGCPVQALVFRETSDASSHTFVLPVTLSPDAVPRVLWGEGHTWLAEARQLGVTIPAPRDFLWLAF